MAKDMNVGVPLDILGSLPENVIDGILMHLPMRDAVRTSILSKKWRYKWCRIPQLNLDLAFWESTKDYSTSPAVKFTEVIYQIITLHVGPISKFILSIRGLRNCPRIDNLIYFLSKKNIQHLVLTLLGGNHYKLPHSLFTCSNLRHLNLLGCLVNLPPAFKGFDRLISLKLVDVTIPSKCLESLISHCPLLEQLLLFHIVCDVIEINAPMLRSFDFIGSAGSLRLKSVPHLAKLFLVHTEYNVGTGNCDIAKFFQSFSALERLELNGNSLEFLAAGAGELLTRLPFDLNSVKCLCLGEFSLGDMDMVSCALCLIRSFPYLQHMEIEVFDEDGDIPALVSLEMEAFLDTAFNHLREVKLVRTIGSKPEMQLIKLLLAKSPVLMRLLIEPWLKGNFAGKTIKIPAVLNSFRRASPEVEVIYNYYGD